VRWDANNINTVNEMIGTAAYIDIVQEADRALKLEEHAHHRVNLVGVHIDENSPHAKTFHIEMPTDLDPRQLQESVLRLSTSSTASSPTTNSSHFFRSEII
jgi:hypothetical protein